MEAGVELEERASGGGGWIEGLAVRRREVRRVGGSSISGSAGDEGSICDGGTGAGADAGAGECLGGAGEA